MVELRRLPWPYKAMLAICSDLDETPDASSYIEYSRYLNTKEKTQAGVGLGLEVGNTMYFDMPPGQFSYWNASEDERERIRALIRSGHIDCFHSFGDSAAGRDDAQRSLSDLEKHGCRLKVWVDHAVAPTNFGPDIMLGRGDIPGDAAYHSDLSALHGVRYVWLGRVTSCLGQGVPYTPWTSLYGSRDRRAFINTIRDVAKLTRGVFGDKKYAMHAGNRLTRDFRLRDGRVLTEFIRCNPNPHGVSVGDNTPGIPAVLNRKMLTLLGRRGGYAIVYTHLGKGLDKETLVPEATRHAFEALAEASERGEILTTTTRRLLDYHMLVKRVSVRSEDGVVHVDSLGECVEGLTLLGLSKDVRCFVDGQETVLQFNPASGDEPASHSIPWPRLRWPL